METVLLQSSNSDSHHHPQSISLNINRFIQNPINFISRSSPENLSLYPNIHEGGGGGSTFYVVPSFYSSSVPVRNQKQPPLLPLHVTKKPYASLPLIPPIRPNNNNNNRPHLPLIPSSPIRKNNNRSSSTRDQPDLNLHTSKKKSKSSSVISPMKQIQPITTIKGGDVNLLISSKQLGPEPCDIPKQVSRVMKQQPAAVKVVDMDEEFSGSIFALAPPPSSLLLPKFSTRPRLSCNVKAVGYGGIDNGAATDNLCRMLRLR